MRLAGKVDGTIDCNDYVEWLMLPFVFQTAACLFSTVHRPDCGSERISKSSFVQRSTVQIIDLDLCSVRSKVYAKASP